MVSWRAAWLHSKMLVWEKDNKALAQHMLVPGFPDTEKISQMPYKKKHLIVNIFCFPSSHSPLIPEPFLHSVPSCLVIATLTCLTCHQWITRGVLGWPPKTAIGTVVWPLAKGRFPLHMQCLCPDPCHLFKTCLLKKGWEVTGGVWLYPQHWGWGQGVCISLLKGCQCDNTFIL